MEELEDAMVIGVWRIVMSRATALKMCFCLMTKWIIEKQMQTIAPVSFSS